MFGAGRPRSNVMLVGEQPGDQEDRQGHPFVGPAGRVLDRALEEAGIDPERTYIDASVELINVSDVGSIGNFVARQENA